LPLSATNQIRIKIVSEIEKTEAEISKLEMQLSEIPIQKEKILGKYL
jgi:hypothetical protein